jgi:hypothetical protein
MTKKADSACFNDEIVTTFSTYSIDEFRAFLYYITVIENDNKGVSDLWMKKRKALSSALLRAARL